MGAQAPMAPTPEVVYRNFDSFIELMFRNCLYFPFSVGFVYIEPEPLFSQVTIKVFG